MSEPHAVEQALNDVVHALPANCRTPSVSKKIAALMVSVRADERERCARVADKYARRGFPWGSENADVYHAQAQWASCVVAAIRALKEDA